MEGLKNWFQYVVDHRDDILQATIQHARISLTVILLASVVSVAVGIYIQRKPTLRAGVMALAGIFLTIPSLALFALFIPIVGIGNTPAEMALFLYALLPILRNTVTGLDEVSPAVVESAKGMGMNDLQLLWRVKLPLAWPVIMAGVRVSTLMVVGIAAIAVLVGGDGLGSFIQGGLTRLGLPNAIESVWAGTVFIILLGLFLDFILGIFQRLTTSPGLRA